MKPVMETSDWNPLMKPVDETSEKPALRPAVRPGT